MHYLTRCRRPAAAATHARRTAGEAYRIWRCFGGAGISGGGLPRLPLRPRVRARCARLRAAFASRFRLCFVATPKFKISKIQEFPGRKNEGNPPASRACGGDGRCCDRSGLFASSDRGAVPPRRACRWPAERRELHVVELLSSGVRSDGSRSVSAPPVNGDACHRTPPALPRARLISIDALDAGLVAPLWASWEQATAPAGKS